MRFVIVTMIFLSLSLFISAEDETIDTVYYVLSAGQTLSDMSPFRSALVSSGYSFKQFDRDLHDVAEVIGFLGTVTQDGKFNFRLLTAKPLFIGELSPILYDRYDDPILRNTVAEFIDIPSRQLLATYLDFTLNYINSDCENVTRIAVQTDASSLQPISESFVNFAIGNCILSTIDADPAVGYLVKAVQLLNDDETAQPFQIIASHINLAWAYIQLGDYMPARETLNQLVEFSSEYSETLQVQILEDRAQLFALMFDYTSAIQDMDTVIERLKSDYSLARAYKQRGDIIMLIYEWNRALGDYNKAIEFDPDYAEAYYRRGILYYTMVERENAIADFETYLELEPDGQFVAFAEQFIVDIQTELDALDG